MFNLEYGHKNVKKYKIELSFVYSSFASGKLIVQTIDSPKFSGWEKWKILEQKWKLILIRQNT